MPMHAPKYEYPDYEPEEQRQFVVIDTAKPGITPISGVYVGWQSALAAYMWRLEITGEKAYPSETLAIAELTYIDMP